MLWTRRRLRWTDRLGPAGSVSPQQANEPVCRNAAFRVPQGATSPFPVRWPSSACSLPRARRERRKRRRPGRRRRQPAVRHSPWSFSFVARSVRSRPALVPMSRHPKLLSRTYVLLLLTSSDVVNSPTRFRSYLSSHVRASAVCQAASGAAVDRTCSRTPASMIGRPADAGRGQHPAELCSNMFMLPIRSMVLSKS